MRMEEPPESGVSILIKAMLGITLFFVLDQRIESLEFMMWGLIIKMHKRHMKNMMEKFVEPNEAIMVSKLELEEMITKW